ncbi:SIR2 family protein [Bacillus sp. OK048]|uniref:SIR2 family protein n=1 Tax=Bacillus sp. OK048 TaxID=1882761 RepID=UPI000887434C|nr:SIR2 family protein [Bacillus sp. OK048]SDM42222.1 SIR2-like domain-containing protein [Bacillus sp. OK048]
MNDIEQLLTNHLKNFDSAPFLFIGSGFSRRYIGLEDWAGLLEKFCVYLSRDFDYYSSRGERNWPVVARLMAEDFFEIWWEKDEFQDSREEYKGKILNRTTPLKIEIAKYLRGKTFEYGKDSKLDNEISHLKEVVIDGIITTNWDLLLEQLFEEQITTTYVGQEELLFSNPKEIAEIYKIHGSSLSPNSLVLSDRDYKGFKDKNAYLAAKLMTIFIEHPVIFIGYSMSDDNIIEILQAITSCLSEDNLYKLKDRLIFIQRDSRQEGDSFQTTTMVIKDTTLSVTSIKTNDFEKVYKGMAGLKRKIPAKVLRQMKSQIYELVRTNDPRGQIYVATDLEKDTDPSKIEFVYGVGITEKLGAVGYKGISPDELFREIVLDTRKYQYSHIVLESLPEALRIDRLIPVFKYCALSEISLEQMDYKVQNALQLKLSDIHNRWQKNNLQWVRKKYKSIQQLENDYEGKEHYLYQFITMLDSENIDQEYLKEFIVKNLTSLDKLESGIRSHFRKLIRFYDWLVYKEKKSIVSPQQKRLGKAKVTTKVKDGLDIS